MLRVTRSTQGHCRAINGEVLKSEGKALTVNEEALKGNEKASKIRNTRISSSISHLTGECAAQKLKNICSSSLWTCLHDN